MELKTIKSDLHTLKTAILLYKKGSKYLKNRYLIANKIMNSKKVSERPLTNLDLSIHVLTGHRDITSLFWAVGSFYNVSSVIGQLFIHSDGTLTNHDQLLIKSKFPSARIITPEEVIKKLKASSPYSRYLTEFRMEHAQNLLLKKLMDPFIVSDKRLRLIIDTDVFWFRDPVFLNNEPTLQRPKSLMMDQTHFPCPVSFTDGSVLSDELSCMNSGIVFYEKSNFDLKKLSNFLKNLDLSKGQNRYFIEEAGYAVSLKNLEVLPREQYSMKVKFSKETIARHYTSPKRALLFIEGIENLKNDLL